MVARCVVADERFAPPPLTIEEERAKVAELRSHLPATEAGIYLNAGSNGPIPREVEAAMRQIHEQELATGRASQHIMDDVEVRIDELRVRGQTRRLTVQPKIKGLGAYEIAAPEPGRDPAHDPKAGQRIWFSLTF